VDALYKCRPILNWTELNCNSFELWNATSCTSELYEIKGQLWLTNMHVSQVNVTKTAAKSSLTSLSIAINHIYRWNYQIYTFGLSQLSAAENVGDTQPSFFLLFHSQNPEGLDGVVYYSQRKFRYSARFCAF